MCLQPSTKYWVKASDYVGTIMDVHLLNLKYNFAWDFPKFLRLLVHVHLVLDTCFVLKKKKRKKKVFYHVPLLRG